MTWLAPWAWVGLIAVAGPVLVHWLARQQADRLRFPTLQFLVATPPVSVRRHRLRDLPLLLVRMLIVVLATAALAQPVWPRPTAPAARPARAIVIDTSASLSRVMADGRPAAAIARETGEALAADARAQGSPAWVESGADVASAVARAAAWVTRQPAPRELVVVSDFQVGALVASDLDVVPADAGSGPPCSRCSRPSGGCAAPRPRHQPRAHRRHQPRRPQQHHRRRRRRLPTQRRRPMAPPDAVVRAALTGVAQRLQQQALCRALCYGAAAAIAPWLVARAWPASPTAVWAIPAAAGAATAALAWVLARRRRTNTAALIEAAVPTCHNVLITADALLAGTLDAKPHVREVVLHDAATRVATLDSARLWPWRPTLIMAAAVIALWAVAPLLPLHTLTRVVTSVAHAAAHPSITQVDIVITPPAYAVQTATTLRDPDRVTPLVGSRVDIRTIADATTATLDTAVGSVPLVRGADGAFTGTLTVDTDGYIAVTPYDAAGAAGARRLIGVTAVPDRAPEVRITEPGKDLFLREGNTRLTVRLQAGDDLGLRILRLAYTKVAGAGESFTFTEGEVPVTITRVSTTEWTAVGVLPLNTMNLDVGDMVVYRGITTDGRPGATPVESDAFIVEIVSASNAMAEGFSIDDRQDKYALSQQMVILKTERLLARAGTMTAGDLLDEAMSLAAEQRSVRAEIVFMMGGEFEDEFAEAEHEHELSDGRLDNSGRADLGVATRAMSRAASQLTAADIKTALATERAALVAMQRALSRRRFILRTLTQREPIDDSRRLQGVLKGVGLQTRASADATISDRVVAARNALRVIADASTHTPLAAEDATRLSAAAATLLATDGRSAPIVDVAARLTTAAAAIVAGRVEEAERALVDASTRLTAVVAAELSGAPDTSGDIERARVQGALADALRRGGRQ
jgi:hypothetical protein